MDRRVYDADHRLLLPGNLVLSERNRTSSDLEAVEAFAGSGLTYDFFRTAFGRDSLDGKGMTMVSSVHYGTGFANALWDGRQMVYGDGDGRLFRRFTASVDVIGHELTHGVTQYSAALQYSGQSGALNEHFSDVCGIMVKQYGRGQTAGQSDWIIGEGLFMPRVHGVGLRSMKAPGTAYDDPILGRDPQPWHMSKYVLTGDDNGGVHINSGIPNHAFYLAATAVGGLTWKTVGRVWYDVLTTRIRPKAQFSDLARETVVTAGRLFGQGGDVERAVAAAWERVGLPVPSSRGNGLARRRGRRPLTSSIRQQLKAKANERKRAA